MIISPLFMQYFRLGAFSLLSFITDVGVQIARDILFCTAKVVYLTPPHVLMFYLTDLHYFIIFLLKYKCYTIVLVSGIQHSDLIFMNLTMCSPHFSIYVSSNQPCKVITLLLTIFPFTFFTHPPPLWQPSVLYISVFVSFCFFVFIFLIPHVSEIMRYLSSSVLVLKGYFRNKYLKYQPRYM